MDPTERFSTRAEEYESARPSYPREVITLMRDALDLAPHHAIADIGSGTGILSRLFLDCGNTVFGVEPNAAMRAVAQDGWPRRGIALGRSLGRFHRRRSGLALVRDIDNGSRVSAGAQARRLGSEWNERRVTGLPFLVEYEAFLERWGTDYLEVRARYDLEPQLSGLFERHDHRAFGNAQELDPRGLRARLLSSSYVPPPDDPQREPMLAALDKLFQEHQVDGRVRIEYDTHVYYGRLKT
jgi:SAM-dependent methyltransferase